MSFYVLLTCCVLTIVYLAVLIWEKTRNPAYMFGIFCMYYWSLHGCWTIIGDNLGTSTEVKHQYLYDDLFVVACNSAYVWTILIYSMFVVAVELTILLTVGKGQRINGPPAPIVVSHRKLLLSASICGIFALFLVRTAVAEAASANVSAYVLSRSEAIPLYSLYTLLNRGAIVPAALGVAILAAGQQGRFIVGKRCFGDFAIYTMLLVVMVGSCVALGNKSEVFMAAISAYLFYMANTLKPRIFTLHAGLAVAMFGFVMMDVIRAVPLRDLTRDFSWLRSEEVLRAAKSNEVFGAHFSLYGAVNYDVPFTYGSSLVSLAASVVPRILWDDRPDGIYVHYATSLGFNSLKAEGQGYSVHHATGWYLNFGIPGVLFGACLFARIWTWLFGLTRHYRRIANRWTDVAIRVCPWVFTAAIPSLLRSGPEGYKGALLEAFIIPVAVLGFARMNLRLEPRIDQVEPDEASTIHRIAA